LTVILTTLSHYRVSVWYFTHSLSAHCRGYALIVSLRLHSSLEQLPSACWSKRKSYGVMARRSLPEAVM